MVPSSVLRGALAPQHCPHWDSLASCHDACKLSHALTSWGTTAPVTARGRIAHHGGPHRFGSIAPADARRPPGPPGPLAEQYRHSARASERGERPHGIHGCRSTGRRVALSAGPGVDETGGAESGCYQNRRTSNASNASSSLTSATSSIWLCAISIRSKGSRGAPGRRPARWACSIVMSSGRKH